MPLQPNDKVVLYEILTAIARGLHKTLGAIAPLV
jgi:hypothetical protein